MGIIKFWNALHSIEVLDISSPSFIFLNTFEHLIQLIPIHRLHCMWNISSLSLCFIFATIVDESPAARVYLISSRSTQVFDKIMTSCSISSSSISKQLPNTKWSTLATWCFEIWGKAYPLFVQILIGYLCSGPSSAKSPNSLWASFHYCCNSFKSFSIVKSKSTSISVTVFSLRVIRFATLALCKKFSWVDRLD